VAVAELAAHSEGAAVAGKSERTTETIKVCDACGAKHFPQVWRSLNKCPSCGHATGTEKEIPIEELQRG
jgi:ribosomal protein L37E